MLKLGGFDWLTVLGLGQLTLGVAVSGMVVSCTVSAAPAAPPTVGLGNHEARRRAEEVLAAIERHS